MRKDIRKGRSLLRSLKDEKERKVRKRYGNWQLAIGNGKSSKAHQDLHELNLDG